MEEIWQAIQMGFGLCLGAAGVGVIVCVVLVIHSRIQHRRQMKRLGDAWLDAVQTLEGVNDD